MFDSFFSGSFYHITTFRPLYWDDGINMDNRRSGYTRLMICANYTGMRVRAKQELTMLYVSLCSIAACSEKSRHRPVIEGLSNLLVQL